MSFRIAIVLALLYLTACAPKTTISSPAEPKPTDPITVSSPMPAPTITPSNTATITPSSTSTPTPAQTATTAITPTFAILRGSVNVDKVSCRYGPGAMYLYLYGMLKGATQDIIGRTDTGTWVLTQARGDVTRCWVKTELLDIDGDVMSVEQVAPHIVLPWSPYYAPLSGVSASRNGNDIHISWHALLLKAGDDSEQTPYVVETWVCRNGQLVFTPIAAYHTFVTITDEPGCTEPSFGFVLAAEKHGYTKPIPIPWP